MKSSKSDNQFKTDFQQLITGLAKNNINILSTDLYWAVP